MWTAIVPAPEPPKSTDDEEGLDSLSSSQQRQEWWCSDPTFVVGTFKKGEQFLFFQCEIGCSRGLAFDIVIEYESAARTIIVAAAAAAADDDGTAATTTVVQPPVIHSAGVLSEYPEMINDIVRLFDDDESAIAVPLPLLTPRSINVVGGGSRVVIHYTTSSDDGGDTAATTTTTTTYRLAPVALFANTIVMPNERVYAPIGRHVLQPQQPPLSATLAPLPVPRLYTLGVDVDIHVAQPVLLERLKQHLDIVRLLNMQGITDEMPVSEATPLIDAFVRQLVHHLKRIVVVAPNCGDCFLWCVDGGHTFCSDSLIITASEAAADNSRKVVVVGGDGSLFRIHESASAMGNHFVLKPYGLQHSILFCNGLAVTRAHQHPPTSSTGIVAVDEEFVLFGGGGGGGGSGTSHCYEIACTPEDGLVIDDTTKRIRFVLGHNTRQRMPNVLSEHTTNRICLERIYHY